MAKVKNAGAAALTVAVEAIRPFCFGGMSVGAKGRKRGHLSIGKMRATELIKSLAAAGTGEVLISALFSAIQAPISDATVKTQSYLARGKEVTDPTGGNGSIKPLTDMDATALKALKALRDALLAVEAESPGSIRILASKLGKSDNIHPDYVGTGGAMATGEW